MPAGIFFTAAAVLLLIALHPFVFYPASLRILKAMRAKQPAVVRVGAPPQQNYSICVCAYNEAPIIRATIESLLALRATAPDLQILLHVDGNGDGTADIARAYGESIDVVVSPERKGKSYGLNRLLSSARGSIVILTDATVRIDPAAVERLGAHFADPQVGCVAGHLRYVNDGESTTAFVGSFYWRLEEAIKQLESDTGSVIGADGSIYAVRRALFRPIPEDMIDDMYLSMRVLCEGYRITRAADVFAYEKSVTESDEEFRRKIRISCQAFAAHRALRPAIARLSRLNRYKYYSHKLIRWFTGYTLTFAALCFIAGIVTAWGWPVALGSVVLAAAFATIGHLAKFRPVILATDILSSFTATAIGVWKALKGDRIRTWEPAGSIRKA